MQTQQALKVASVALHPMGLRRLYRICFIREDKGISRGVKKYAGVADLVIDLESFIDILMLSEVSSSRCDRKRKI